MQTKRGKVTSSFLLFPKSSESDLEALEFDDLDMSGDSERTRLVEAEAPTATRPTSYSCSEAEEDSPNMRQPKSTVYVWQLAVFAAIGGFLFGYDTGVVSGAMLLLRERFHLSSFQQELVVSVTIGACCVSALLGGVVTDRLGRKPVTLLASFVFMVGAVVLGVAQNVAMLVAGRLTVGIGVGLASMAVPIYIAECAPPHIRGRMVAVNQLFITWGQFTASLLDGGFSYVAQDGWRYMLGLGGVPAVLQFCGFLFLPESPRWLMQQGQKERARAVLVKLRGSEDVEEEIKDMQTTKESPNSSAAEKNERARLVRVLTTPHVRRALFVGCGVQFFQQMVGINTVMYYSASIIKMAGISDQHTAIWLSAMTAGVNFVFTLVGVWLVERLGRRKLIIGSIFGVMLSLVVLAVAFQLAAFHSPPLSGDPASSSPCAKYRWCEACIEDAGCGYCFKATEDQAHGSCLPTNPKDNVQTVSGPCTGSQPAGGYVWAYEYCPTPYSWIAILGLVLYLAFFAPGLGPMPWTINSEIYPLWARSTGNALAASTNWICNLLVSATFLTLTETLTKHGTYWLLTSISLCGLLFFLVFVPETKGRKLEEVEELFKTPWCGEQSKTSPRSNASHLS